MKLQICYFAILSTCLLISTSCTTVDNERAPQLQTELVFEPSLASKAMQFCDENYGEIILEKVETEGYTDLRWDLGCGHQCIREFLRTQVSFVEAKVEAGKETLQLDSLFPDESGKFKYYISETGDPRCAQFEVVAGGSYRNWLGLSSSECIAVQKVEKFTAKYSVERAYTTGKPESGNSMVSNYTMFSTVIRDQESQLIIAENTSVNIVFAEPGVSNPEGVHLTCKSNYDWRFLPSVLKPHK